MDRIGNNNIYKGFTLVELIIVVTILSVLSTIAFISFQGYSKNSRDANRLGTIKNIETGLNIYQTKVSKLPLPEDYLTITSSGETIGYQGYLGESSSLVISMNEIPLDPFDKNKFTYLTNLSLNKYQLLTLLETSNGLSFNDFIPINKTYAEGNTYGNRYPKVFGQKLGVLLSTSGEYVNIPLQYFKSDSFTGIELKTYDGENGNIASMLSNEITLIGTGKILNSIKSSFKDGKSWLTLDRNCNVPDIIIGDQIWSGCNSTLGNGLEWKNGTCQNYLGINDTTDCNNDEYMASNKKEKDWSLASSIPGTVNNIWGKFYSETQADSACTSGWRLPTYNDYMKLLEELNGGLDEGCVGPCWTGLGWQGNELKDSSNNLIQALQIPLSGLNSNTSNTFGVRGRTGNLFILDDNYNSVRIFYDKNTVSILYSPVSSSVRCIKN